MFLPSVDAFIKNDVTEAEFKVAQAALVEYVGGILATAKKYTDSVFVEENIGVLTEIMNNNLAQLINDLNNAIQIASAAGAGANGWTDALVLTKNNRTQRDKNNDFVSVKDYGAKGDGVTDDTTAIQAAVDAMAIKGGNLFLPAGRYIITKSITWRSNVSLYGEGAGKSIIASKGVLFSAIKNTTGGPSSGDTQTATPLYDVTFANFEIDCSGLTHPYASVEGKGFFILYMVRARFLNLYVHDSIGTGIGCDFLVDTLIHGCTVERAGRNWGLAEGGMTASGGGQSGIGVGTGWKDVESLTVSDCFTRDCGNYGIFVETQQGDKQVRFPDGCRVVNCYAEGSRINYGNKGSGGVMWVGCQSRSARESGFVFSQNSRNDTLIGCESTLSGNAGLELNNYFGGLTIRASRFSENSDEGILITVAGSGDAARDLHISDCLIVNNGFSGILFNGAGRGISDYSVRNCTLRANGQKQTSGKRSGVSLYNTLTNGVISANTMSNNIGETTQQAHISDKYSTINGLHISNNNLQDTVTTISVTGANIIARGNVGYNYKVYANALTPTASPWVYTAGQADEMIYLTGTDLRVDIGGQVVTQNVTSTNVLVPANSSITIRYTAITGARKTQL
ncbi:hypothetical protein N5E37_07830 [Acinetobacter johnsonii]|uniref:right-handed parallel beta-helix repeat-containing protein n=1 Tax=Acinetobacter johnsonii TaxID=40214 RepID=UPI00244A2117|nr:right-handed parallel beta-helix repeat-containing protein [Acinetobacter johnsonii]MDH1726104.1 hypothetical protein [Acinetobacter johnsonii]